MTGESPGGGGGAQAPTVWGFSALALLAFGWLCGKDTEQHSWPQDVQRKTFPDIAQDPLVEDCWVRQLFRA